MTRIDELPGRGFSVTFADYTFELTPHGLPAFYHGLVEHAALLEEYEPHEHNLCCLTVRKHGDAWPFLVVTQSQPEQGGFAPCVLLVPDTKVLFVGVGQRILAYRLEPAQKIWEDRVDVGCLGWEQRGDTILLCAELELAAWDTAAHKLWTTFVEPPWKFTLQGDLIELDVMGKKRSFGLREGPP